MMQILKTYRVLPDLMRIYIWDNVGPATQKQLSLKNYLEKGVEKVLEEVQRYVLGDEMIEKLKRYEGGIKKEKDESFSVFVEKLEQAWREIGIVDSLSSSILTRRNNCNKTNSHKRKQKNEILARTQPNKPKCVHKIKQIRPNKYTDSTQLNQIRTRTPTINPNKYTDSNTDSTQLNQIRTRTPAINPNKYTDLNTDSTQLNQIRTQP